MRPHRPRSRALLVAAALLAAACTSDGVPGEERRDGGGERDQSASLRHVEPCDGAERSCAPELEASDGLALGARLTDRQGAPIPNASIDFSIEGTHATGSTLSAERATTDTDGIARILFLAGPDTGAVRVTAAAPDASRDPALEYLVTVVTPRASMLRVALRPIGTFRPGAVRAQLFDEATSCAAFLEAPDRAPASLTQREVALPASGELPTIEFPDALPGRSYVVGARAFADRSASVELARGCIAGARRPKPGEPSAGAPTIALVQNLPHLPGAYRVRHLVDLRGALPGPIQTIVDLIGNVVSDPGALLVGCGARDEASGELLATPDCSRPRRGLVGLLADFLGSISETGIFAQLASAIDAFLGSTLARDTARIVINETVTDFLEESDAVPQWAKSGVVVTRDVLEVLQRFRVDATLRIAEQPRFALGPDGLPIVDAAGALVARWQGAPNTHVWDDVVVRWRRGCGPDDPETCGEEIAIASGVVATDDTFVSGNWGGAVRATPEGIAIEIEEHALSIAYGRLVLAVLEAVVLPRVFGDPGVNSIEAMLDKLFVCANLGASVNARVPGTAEIVSALCTEMKARATDALRSYASSYVLEGDDRLLFATAPGAPCAIQLAPSPPASRPGAPRPAVDTLGFGRGELGCDAAMRVSFRAGSEGSDLVGTFGGARSE